MIQFFALVIFMLLAFGIMAAALHFSQYKKREESCCGGGHCSVSDANEHEHTHECDGTGSCASGGHDHGCETGTCYSSKEDFVNNFEKIKIKRLKTEN